MKCAWPDCQEDGCFPAPKNPRNLSERQYFCAAHIKEFNKRWNGLNGFSEHEIYDMQDGTAKWLRPTWDMNLKAFGPATGSAKAAATETLFANADDLYGFFTNRVLRERAGESLPSTRHLPADVKEACAIFSIEQPLEAAMLKKRYLNLVKQHHPDVNTSPDAPEHIKRINVAFRILTDYAERHTQPPGYA